MGDWRFRYNRCAKVTMQNARSIIKELLPHGLIQTHFMTQLCKSHWINTTFTTAHLDWITRHKTQHCEGHKHQCNESGDRQQQAFDEKAEHENYPPSPISAGKANVF